MIQVHQRVGVAAMPASALALLGDVDLLAHPRGVEPPEERLALPIGVGHPVERALEHLLVEGLLPLGAQRPGVLDDLPANTAPGRIDRRVVAVAGTRQDHVARTTGETGPWGTRAALASPSC